MKVTKQRWSLSLEGERNHWSSENPTEMIVGGETHGQVVGYAKFLGINKEYLITPDNLGFARIYGPDYYKTKYYDLQGKSICDIGGGPTSLLLRCQNFSKATVVDPILATDRVKDRYKECGINFKNVMAEEFKYDQIYDEIWIYNCLHHTMDPEKILEDAKKHCKVLRIYEILHTGKDLMHPQSFNREFFDNILGPGGQVTDMKESEPSPRGLGYHGVFQCLY